MTTLGNGIATITPDFIDEYESTSEHGNIVHRILGSESVDVVLRPASLRSGRMSLGITDDTVLAFFYAHERGARIYDGPDEVHRMVVSRRVLRAFQDGGVQLLD